MRVVVNDANILIDLIDANLLELFFKLKFEMNISDSVVGEFENEEDITRINRFIEKGKLRLHSFTHDQITEIIESGCVILHDFPDCTSKTEYVDGY